MLYLQPYYVANVGVVASWAALRHCLPGAETLLKDEGTWFATREREIFMLVGLGLLAKARRASSTHEYIFKVCWYGKVAVGLCLARSNLPALALYLCVLSLMFVALPNPTFAGQDRVHVLDAARFVETVLRPTDDKIWLVAFTADWCESCAHAQPLFCSLAAEHASKRRGFAQVDVAANPTIARRFNVDLSYRTLQLPTYALFVGGREKRRLPYLDDKNVVVKTKFTRDSLQAYFLLDMSVKDARNIINDIDAKKAADKAAAAFVEAKHHEKPSYK